MSETPSNIAVQEQIDEIFGRCSQAAPNVRLSRDVFTASVSKSLNKFLDAPADAPATDAEVAAFVTRLHADDLHLALACAEGDEHAWWEFDHQYRDYIRRVARGLTNSDAAAADAIDVVYTELYGTRFLGGSRASKFTLYSGRGTLRAWLKSVIWHSMVDLHRSSRRTISLDQMTENATEGGNSIVSQLAAGGEPDAIADLDRENYRKATIAALDAAFASLEDHEKLLLLYYHVEELTLREITALLENESSELRRWFQRGKDRDPSKRVHESTVMRWLDRSYAKISQLFRAELGANHGLCETEIESCIEIAATEDSGRSIFASLSV